MEASQAQHDMSCTHLLVRPLTLFQLLLLALERHIPASVARYTYTYTRKILAHSPHLLPLPAPPNKLTRATLIRLTLTRHSCARICKVDTGDSPGFRENFGRRAGFLIVNERTSLVSVVPRHLPSFPYYPSKEDDRC